MANVWVGRGSAHGSVCAHCLNQRTLGLSRNVKSSRSHSVKCEAAPMQAEASSSKVDSFKLLETAFADYKSAPPSEKYDATGDILSAMRSLKEEGKLAKWGAALEGAGLTRRNVFLNELKRVGIQNPEAIGTPTVRNDAAFLFSTCAVTGAIAVLGLQLPGDWGFFVPYLVGGIPIVVLAIGSTAPGLLQFFIDKFSRVFPDYRERVLAHEAAHFLMGYLLGVPVTDYSLDIGQAHTDFAEAKLQVRLYERTLEDAEVDQLAVVAMAGASAEGMKYEEVVGQTADLVDLQRLLSRSKTRLNASQQMNVTRWAVYQACSILKTYSKEYAALQECMKEGAPVGKCMTAIENA